MKRYITEMANDIKGRVVDPDTRKEIDDIVQACKRGFLAEADTIRGLVDIMENDVLPELYAMEYKVYTDEDLTGIDCILHPDDRCRIDVVNRGKYALVSIIAADPERELYAQIDDGVFENIKVTKVERA